MASHSNTLACKIPWMAEPGRLQSMGFKESDMTERLHFTFTQPSETQASFLMHSFFIHSSRFLLKNVWSLSAALLWLSSLEATEVLTPIFHGGGVCLYHVMALLTEGGTGLPRNVRAFQTPGATITLYHHFPLSGHLLWVQIHLNYFPSYFYWPAVEIYWTSNVYLSFPYHIDNTTYYCPFSYSLVKHSWAK